MGRRKGQLKEKVGFSIDKEVNDLLEEYCTTNLSNKSKLVNHLIKKFLAKKTEDNING